VRNGSAEFIVDSDPGARPDILQAVADGVGRAFSLTADGPAQRVRRIWLDTFDWRLYRAGMALEQVFTHGRTELVLTGRDGEPLATAHGGSAERVPASNGAGGNRDAHDWRATPTWPALVGALPAGPLRELLEPVVGVRALCPVAKATSQIRQQRVLNSDRKTVARLAVDQMAVSYPAKALVAPRLSITAIRGYQSQAGRLSSVLTGTPGIHLGAVSALDSALAAAGTEPALRAGGVELTDRMPAVTAVAGILIDLLDAVEANVPGTVRDIDTEFLHDLRVAVRRTRAVLKLAGAALPADLVSHYRPEFKWLGDLTTPTRDLDVHLLGFDEMTESLVAATSADLGPFRAYLVRTRSAAHRELSRGLRSARFARITSEWRAALAEVRPPRRRPTVAALAGRQIAVAQRRALRAGQRVSVGSPAQDLHDLRKRCKELRYVIEMFGSLHEPAQRWQAVRELKALQDCLGEFQDAEVQRAEIGSFADRMLAERSAPAATLLAMGEVAAGLARRQHKARIEFDGRFAAFASEASQARLTALTQMAGA
jgi:CHAD domain-containing protein